MSTQAAPKQGHPDIEDDFKAAMHRAGHLLASRPRSEHELRVRLGVAGYADDVVEKTVSRLIELRLLNDLEFAHQWVTERAISKGRAPDALLSELVDKGVDRSVAEQAIAESGVDVDAQAKDLAARFVSKVANKPLEKQAEALLGRLLRRGFSHEVAREAVRSVLPPEGWD